MKKIFPDTTSKQRSVVWHRIGGGDGGGEISEVQHNVITCFSDQQQKSESLQAVSLFYRHISYVETVAAQ
jgi:hypothetical protein